MSTNVNNDVSKDPPIDAVSKDGNWMSTLSTARTKKIVSFPIALPIHLFS